MKPTANRRQGDAQAEPGDADALAKHPAIRATFLPWLLAEWRAARDAWSTWAVHHAREEHMETRMETRDAHAAKEAGASARVERLVAILVKAFPGEAIFQCLHRAPETWEHYSTPKGLAELEALAARLTEALAAELEAQTQGEPESKPPAPAHVVVTEDVRRFVRHLLRHSTPQSHEDYADLLGWRKERVGAVLRAAIDAGFLEMRGASRRKESVVYIVTPAGRAHAEATSPRHAARTPSRTEAGPKRD